MTHIDVVVGGQFGSEGKGHVTAQLVNQALYNDEDHPTGNVVNIRVAGPNAGHTVYDREGNKFALRSVPVGAAVHDDVELYLAPGSEIELPVLLEEIELLREHGHRVDKLYVSGEATLLTGGHKRREQALGMAGRLGSTAKGIGACRSDRIMRIADRVQDDQDAVDALEQAGVTIVYGDRYWVEGILGRSDSVIVEGTQGYGLGLHAGHYPRCTSSDTRAVDFLAMAGISPWSAKVASLSVWVCARVYPIRVAGNSGYMQGETTWEDLGLEPETTTVTHKVRRVGEWDPTLIRDAVIANGDAPTVRVALTMADQKVSEVEGATGGIRPWLSRSNALSELVRQVEADSGAPVGMVTTSPSTALF